MSAGNVPLVDFRRLFVISYLQVAKEQLVPQNKFEAFYPFIVAAAEPYPDKFFDSNEIARRLREAFGWPVGGDFVDLFSSDLARRGLLRSIEHKDGIKYYWQSDAQDEQSGEVSKEIEHLQSSFFEFSESLAALLLHNAGPDNRLHQLATLIASNQLFSQDSLADYAHRATSSKRLIDDDDFEYISAKYILWARKNDERSFKALEILASLGIVTQLATFFHKREDRLEKTGSPILILDGPLILDLAGFNGPDRHHDTQLLINFARSKGCKIWIFRHLIFEAKDIVKAVLMSLPSERYGPLGLALRRREISQDALQLFLDDPVGLTERLVAADRIIDVDPRRFRAESEAFTDPDWQEMYGALSSWNSDAARSRDCDSVSAIMRLRDSNVAQSPWLSSYLMLTSNSLLVQLAKRTCVSIGLIKEVDVGPAITRSEFAALLWLAGDPNNKLEIVSSQLLAAAQGVIAQDKDLVERLKEYSANVSSTRKEFVDAVVQTELSYEFLQNVTLGDPRRVDDNSIQAVVDAILEEGRKEGVSTATARHRESARRMREQAHLAEAARDEAENTTAKTVAESEKLAQARDAEAAGKAQAMQRAAIELGKRKKVVDILDAVIRSAESEWSERYKTCRHASLWLFFILFAGAGGLAIMLSVALRNMSGVAFVAIIFVAAALFALTEWAKAFRGKFVDWASEGLVKKFLEKRKRRLVRQLKAGFFEIKTEFSGDTVQIANRSDLLSAAQGDEAAPPTPEQA